MSKRFIVVALVATGLLGGCVHHHDWARRYPPGCAQPSGPWPPPAPLPPPRAPGL